MGVRVATHDRLRHLHGGYLPPGDDLRHRALSWFAALGRALRHARRADWLRVPGAAPLQGPVGGLTVRPDRFRSPQAVAEAWDRDLTWARSESLNISIPESQKSEAPRPYSLYPKAYALNPQYRELGACLSLKV
ncbi:unnamed protein product [Symbiodinium sp. CCMP2456]|nr:unnamed protein product [Symbiodinium sp. CCMP2456]